MNKIILNALKITPDINQDIKYQMLTNETFGIKQLKLEIINDTTLELNYNFENETKLEVVITINKNKKLTIIEKLNGKSSKIKTQYYLKPNSWANITKINDIETIKEYTIINLENDSQIEYNLKTIAKNKEEYDILTYHNGNNSKSKIITNGLAIKEGNIKLNISSFVPKQKKNCHVNQINKIINLTEMESIIKPNLYIDEYDVEASHSAWIGTFNEQELFYLKSRGIDSKTSEKILVEGFLTNKLEETLKEEIKTKIEKYWRW